MGKYADQARATMARYRKTASTATDEYAVVSPELYEIWQPDRQYYDGTDNVHPQSKVRGITYSDLLYKCQQSHVSQSDWEPSLVPALWVVINEDKDAGTIDNPIKAVAGMEYTYGLYYLDPDDNHIYLCERTGEPYGGKITLYYLPHDLIGQYFTLAK